MSNTWFDNAFSTAKSSKKPLFKIPSASLISKPNQTLNGISQLTSRKRVKSEDSGDIYKQPSSSKQVLPASLSIKPILIFCIFNSSYASLKLSI